jgi:hypothetical protein
MLVIARADVLLLVSVTECGWLGVPTLRVVLKAIEVGEALIGVTAVPCTATLCGLPIPLYVIEIFPVCSPVAVAVGAKLTLSVQEVPAANEELQPL